MHSQGEGKPFLLVSELGWSSVNAWGTGTPGTTWHVQNEAEDMG